MVDKYLILTDVDINLYTNIVNVNINEEGEIVDVNINPQSKVKYSKEKNSKVKDSSSTTATESEEENLVADTDADSVQQDGKSVAPVDADSTKQTKEPVAPVSADLTKQDDSLASIENYYLQEVRKQVMCSSNDRQDMIRAYETYKDLGFILSVLKTATEDNIVRNGRCKINSFSYFLPILEDRWEDKNKGVGKDEPNRTDSQKGPGYNLEEFLWTGES